MPPNLMSKWPLPMNPSLVEDLPPHADTPCPMSTEPLPDVKVHWNLKAQCAQERSNAAVMKLQGL